MEHANKTLLRANWVAPMDGPPVRDGAVVFAGEAIVAVGDAGLLARSHPDADQRDLGHSIILPGLINAHVHLELSDIPRVDAGGSLADWLIDVIKRSPQADDAARVAHAVGIGVAQCLRFGVTTVGDISRQPGLTRPMLRNSPLRVVSFGEIQAMAGRRQLLEQRLAAAADRTHECRRLRIGLSPHAPYSVEPGAYERCVRLARDEHYPISTHLAESPDEAEFLANHAGPFRKLWDFLQAWDEHVPRFGGGPIRLAKSLGLLDAATVLAHVNYCDDAELALLAAGNASVLYCPRTHAHFGHPPHRWREMLAAGVNVAVGTDSLASSPDLNLVDEIRLLRSIARDVPAFNLWQMITTRAARALGMAGTIGSLEPGNQADFACFPAPPGDDPLESLLHEPVVPRLVWIAGAVATSPHAADHLRL